MSAAYACIPRHHGIRRLRDLRKPVHLVASPEELPPPAFPKPAQLTRWVRAPYRALPKQESEIVTDRIDAITPAAQYLNALIDLAGNDVAYPAVKDEFDAVIQFFGDAPDHERFAHSYARYLADGQAEAEELQRVFLHFTWWLKLKQAAQGGAA